MSRVAQYRIAVCLAATALLAWGCAQAPTAVLQPRASTPAFVRVPVSAAQRFASGSSSIDTTIIDGAKGGTVTNGRFLLVVPPGAFQGSASLCITIPDASVMQCQLSISPPEANHFAVPVELVADYSGGNVVLPSQLATLWLDEVNQRWVEMPGSVVSPQGRTITTPLMHFSDYGIAAGKAGW